MNTENDGIENTQSDDTTSIEGHVADERLNDVLNDMGKIHEALVSAYEEEFAEGLATQEKGLEAVGDPDGLGTDDLTQDEMTEVERALDVEDRENEEEDELAASTDEAADKQDAASETTKDVKPKGPLAYAAFMMAVENHAKALGLNIKEQSSFFQVSATTSGHKLYIEKAVKKPIARIDTTLPRSVLTVNGRDLSIPLSKPNGRIVCHIDPTVESVVQAMAVLASYGDKLPAPKKPAAKASAPAT